MMKNRFNYLILILLFGFIDSSFSYQWQDVAMKSNIKYPFTEDNTPYQDISSYKFKKLLERWEKKEFQDKQIAEYEKYGISKPLATRAINERLKLAREVVKNNFPNKFDISPTLDSLDNRVATMNHIAVLGHERFKKLVDKYEMGIDDGFYQCLCRSKGIMGTGLGYSPEPDNHCDTTDPCKGGNWGCVSSDFPKKGDSWINCAKKYRLKDGHNIFQAFDEHVNTSGKFNQDELARKLFDRTLKFKKACLPSMDAKNIDDIQSVFKSPITRKAIDISETSENICEEAIEVNLHLNSNRGITRPELAISLLKPWVMPSEYSEVETFVTSDKGKNYILEKIKSKLIGEIPFSGKVNNLLSNGLLILDSLKAYNMDNNYKEAHRLFVKSKDWNIDQLESKEGSLNEKIDSINNQMKNTDDRFEMIYNRDQLELEAKNYGYKPRNKIELAFSPHKSIWKKFFKNQQELRKKADLEKRRLGLERMRLQLQIKVISEYRKPLVNKGCEAFIKDRMQQCEEKRRRDSRPLIIRQG